MGAPAPPPLWQTQLALATASDDAVSDEMALIVDGIETMAELLGRSLLTPATAVSEPSEFPYAAALTAPCGLSVDVSSTMIGGLHGDGRRPRYQGGRRGPNASGVLSLVRLCAAALSSDGWPPGLRLRTATQRLLSRRSVFRQ